MGAVFAFGAGTANILTAPPHAVVAGMRLTFAVAAGLIVIALAIAVAAQAVSRRTHFSTREQGDAHV
jgi:predicted nicotinamide N-methyase